MQTPEKTITRLSADDVIVHIGQLGALMRASVHSGASIGYILPFEQADGEAFWANTIMPQVRRGARDLLVAREDQTIVGTVQLVTDTPPNQPHRAEIAKLMVHPDFRRRGIARALMAEVEALARDYHRTLLTLDTRTNDMAQPLYASLGFQVAGTIPGYCLDPFGDGIDSTTYMYKAL